MSAPSPNAPATRFVICEGTRRAARVVLRIPWFWFAAITILVFRRGNMMPDWGFWEWIAYGSLAVAAIGIAANSTLQETPGLRHLVPQFLRDGLRTRCFSWAERDYLYPSFFRNNSHRGRSSLIYVHAILWAVHCSRQYVRSTNRW